MNFMPELPEPTLEKKLPSLESLRAARSGKSVGPALKVPKISVKGLNFFYGDQQALYENDLTIWEGRVTAIIGPSGCGKSTHLRTYNRIYQLYRGHRAEGEIHIDGENILDPTVDMLQLRRRVGMIFQKPTPLPRSIFENVAYGLRLHYRMAKDELAFRVEESLKRAALFEEVKDKLHRRGGDLSGGQQQRLCIARAIAPEPDILLMDEPCSSLDPIATRKIEELIDQLRGVFTVVIVTHNMQQAIRVSDDTAVMYMGRLVEFGPTDRVFHEPREQITADYIQGRMG